MIRYRKDFIGLEGYDKIGRIPRQGQKTKIGNYNRTRVEQEKKIKSKSKRKFK